MLLRKLQHHKQQLFRLPTSAFSPTNKAGNHFMLQQLNYKLFIAIALTILFSSGLYAQVTLPDATKVPKEKFIVFIVVGHSNVAGRALDSKINYSTDILSHFHLDELFRGEAHPRCWNYWIHDGFNNFHPELHHTFIPAVEKIHAGSKLSLDRNGPSVAILKAFAQRYPDYHFGVIHNANRIAQLKTHYVDNQPLEGQYLLSQLKEAIASLKGKVSFGGVITNFGAIEKGSESLANNHDKHMVEFANILRAETGNPNLPFLVSGYEMGAKGEWAPSSGYLPTIVKKIENIPSILSNSYVVDGHWTTHFNKMFFQDGHHLNNWGMVEWANRIVATALSHNILPRSIPVDITPPPAPEGLGIYKVEEKLTVFSWNPVEDQGSGVAYYVVGVDGDSAFISQIESNEGNPSIRIATSGGLQLFSNENKENTEITIKAVDYAGNSSPWSKPFAYGDNAHLLPDPPRNLYVDSTFADGIKLSWLPPETEDVVEYQLFIGNKLQGTTTQLSAVFTDLEQQKTYTFGVKTVTDIGASFALTIDVTLGEKPPAYTFFAPQSDTTLRVGDTLTIRWNADKSQVQIATLEISINDGLTWNTITPNQITLQDTHWGAFPWIIPCNVFDAALPGADIRFRVIDYEDKNLFTVSDAVIHIEDGSCQTSTRDVHKKQAVTKLRPVFVNNRIVISGDLRKTSVRLIALNGSTIASKQLTTQHQTQLIPHSSLLQGYYIVQITTHGAIPTVQHLPFVIVQ